MQPEIAEILQRCRQPFNTNSIAQAAALAAMQDKEHQEKTILMTLEGRKRLENFCKAQKLEYVPSEANFLMIKVGDSQKVFQKMMEKGIIVRPLGGGYHLPEWIRVTIGTPEQMKKFEKAFQEVVA
jgi:histidinol-phosphate aminotransferase